tara:strand:+ start:657 stop:1583 length:927 start_codon:yes stop_codon:yes gene_type:complete
MNSNDETLEKFNQFLEVEKCSYSDCLGVLEHDYEIDGVNAKIKLHYVKLDGNGRPMVKALANTLYEYIINYCIASKNRNSQLTPRQSTKLTREARDLFRRPEVTDESPDKTGEAGEMLLYFLMESVMGAPQVVSKMELKTNRKDEVKGSDGIHAKYDSESGLVDFYFGESKLYKSSSSAISSALHSVNDFHDGEMYKHEYKMVTKHYKYADEQTKQAIQGLIVNGEPGPSVRVNHACLIGYDFETFKSKPYMALDDFKEEFLKDGSRLTTLLQKKFDKFEKQYLCFEVFFIPFPSVVEFRNAFNEALG